MSISDSIRINKVISDDTSNLNLANTLIVIKTDSTGISGHENAAMLLKNSSSTTDINFSKIYSATSSGVTNLYFNPNNSSNLSDNHIIINKNNLESELEEVYANATMAIKNLAIGSTSSTDQVYINFMSSGDENEAENGIGFKSNGGDLFYKERGGSWTSISSVSGVSELNGLSDVSISSVAANQLLVYNNSTSKFENTSDITLAGTLDLGGNLTVGSNYLKFNNNHGLVDSVGNEIINLVGNTTDKGNVNYIQVENAAPGSEPKLKSYGSDSSIGLDIETKGEGDVTLTSPSGNIVISSTNLDLSGYHKDSIYSTSSNSSYAPDENWNVPISSDTILFNFEQADSAGTYLATVTDGIHGQKLNIIFNNSGNKVINVLVDFSSNNLITGSGLSTKLKFFTTGQSASLVYLGNSINKWQILNTGSAVL